MKFTEASLEQSFVELLREKGFRAFSHYKSVLQKPFRLEPNLKYPPYSEGKLNWIKRFMR